jgi:sugar phosphate isomerase/epimerase
MTQITILNDIIHSDLDASLDIQKSWGIQIVDLRSGIFGKNFMQLTDVEAQSAVQATQDRGMSVYCLSSGLFFDDIEKGEAYFRETHLNKVGRLIELGYIFQPSVIRLLSATSSKRVDFTDSFEYLQKQHSWVIPIYREAIDLIAEAGFMVTLENEVKENLFTTPEEIVRFFQALDRSDRCTFTFDVQNLWLMGTFPTMEVYRQLAPLIGYYHLKGGLVDETGVKLKFKSSLADASWPVAEMTRALVSDGRCGAICLNPSHGEDKPGYDDMEINRQNVEFLKSLLAE